MCKIISKSIFVSTILVFAVILIMPLAEAERTLKIGFVDLRKAFYEGEKSKILENELKSNTVKVKEEGEKLSEGVRKLWEESELLVGKAKEMKLSKYNTQVASLNKFNQDARKRFLSNQNEIFKEIIDDIQKVVKKIGKDGDYDYIIDSRNVMYSKDAYDLTDDVLATLNK